MNNGNISRMYPDISKRAHAWLSNQNWWLSINSNPLRSIALNSLSKTSINMIKCMPFIKMHLTIIIHTVSTTKPGRKKARLIGKKKSFHSLCFSFYPSISKQILFICNRSCIFSSCKLFQLNGIVNRKSLMCNIYQIFTHPYYSVRMIIINTYLERKEKEKHYYNAKKSMEVSIMIFWKQSIFYYYLSICIYPKQEEMWKTYQLNFKFWVSLMT